MNIRSALFSLIIAVNSYAANWQFADSSSNENYSIIYFLDSDSLTSPIDNKVSFWVKTISLDTLNSLIIDDKIQVKIAPILRSKILGNYKPKIFFFKEYKDSIAKNLDNKEMEKKNIDDLILLAISAEVLVNNTNIKADNIALMEFDCSKNSSKINQLISYNQDGTIKSMSITPTPWMVSPPESKLSIWSKLVCGKNHFGN